MRNDCCFHRRKRASTATTLRFHPAWGSVCSSAASPVYSFWLLLVALSGTLQADGAAGSWLDVKAWQATFTHRLIDAGETKETTTWGMTTTTKWTVNDDFRVVCYFPGRSSRLNSRTWGSETNEEQQVQIDEEVVETKVFKTGESITTRYVSGVAGNPNLGSFWLDIYDNTYVVGLNCVVGAGNTNIYEDREPFIWGNWISFSTNGLIYGTLPVGTNVVPLSGSYRCRAKGLPSYYGGSALGHASPEAELEVTWFLEPRELEDEELVVEIADYDQWLPQGSTDEHTPGNSAFIKARLQKPGGGAPEVKVRKFKMELLSVSHEPGVCMNFPIHPVPPAQPDLQFLAELNPDWQLQSGSTQAVVMESKEGEFVESPDAILSSFDWGAYGLLRVTAQLASGRTVAGYLINDPAQNDIRIPRREDGSYTAQAWKEAKRATTLGDMDDSDNEPEGDGHAGDGLTLYEEYRGFYEGGIDNHIDGNPRKKDFFVRNRIGEATGIVMTGLISGLEVHYKFTDGEFPSNRVMNANHSMGAPHLVDQHGVVLELQTLNGASGRTCGGPSIPKYITRVLIGRDEAAAEPQGGVSWTALPRYGTNVQRASFPALVAHELLHACNVRHHGPADPGARWKIERNPDGSVVFKERGETIRVLRENGQPYTPGSSTDTAWSVWLGAPRAQHSGYEDCVMRYAVAEAYASLSDPTVRYWVGDDELTGNALCTSATGTGVNAADRSPQSRYGDAERGGCQHQICVNDSTYHLPGPQTCQ